MSPAFLIIFCSLVWLCWRAVQLWSTPLTLVLRHLQIEVPSPPQLTIDALTSDSISLHWAPPDSYVKKHVIQMDGHEVGVSEKGETSVTISGLKKDYLYSIQVVAVNAQGFQVASPTVYVRTRPKEDTTARCDADDAAHHLEHQKKNCDAPSEANRDSSKRTDTEAVLAQEDDLREPVQTRLNESAARDDINNWTLMLDTVVKEAAEVDQQFAQNIEAHAQEEVGIMKKLEDLRTRKKEEDDARSLKDQHHKHLDQQKREVESRRNQVQKALKSEQDTYRKQTADIESFALSGKDADETIKQLHESLENLKVETDQAVLEAERVGVNAAEELSEIESEIRYLLLRKTEAESELARLLAGSRVSSPSPQELQDAALADAQWKEREDSLTRQFEEAQYKFMRLQNNAYAIHDPKLAQVNSDLGLEHGPSLGRHGSRRLPHFNPDAQPFIASSHGFTRTSSPPVHARHVHAFASTEQHPYVPNNDPMVFPNSRFSAGHSLGPTSIFLDEASQSRNASPFVRDSPRSSQSGSNPSSPAVHPRGPTSSIFNTAPAIVQRQSSGSLVASLNGTPLDETSEAALPDADSSKRFWAIKKSVADPLALDRKNTRSLPKVDVAPIGTRRLRSGSMHEGSPGTSSPDPTLVSHNSQNGYPDLDLLGPIGRKVLREPSIEKDSYAMSALPLPRLSHGSAFGWRPSHSLLSTPRKIPNPWNSSEPEQAGPAPGFDPFADLPNTNNTSSQIGDLDSDFLSPPTSYHTTVEGSRLSSLNREQSNGSRRSSKSKTESHESSPRMKKLGDGRRFSSFVGRVFGKKEDRESTDVDGEQSLNDTGIAL